MVRIPVLSLTETPTPYQLTITGGSAVERTTATATAITNENGFDEQLPSITIRRVPSVPVEKTVFFLRHGISSWNVAVRPFM